MKYTIKNSHRHYGFTLIELMIVIAIIAVLASIMSPNFVRARSQAHLTACKSNVKNIGTACEMYSVSHESRYPTSLAQLTEGNSSGYLKMIPSCPAAGYDTYSAGYAYATHPDAFTVRCMGGNHASVDIAGDFPLYDSVGGLMAKAEDGTAVSMSSGSSGSSSVSSGSSGVSSGSSGGSSVSGSDSATSAKKSLNVGDKASVTAKETSSFSGGFDPDENLLKSTQTGGGGLGQTDLGSSLVNGPGDYDGGYDGAMNFF